MVITTNKVRNFCQNIRAVAKKKTILSSSLRISVEENNSIRQLEYFFSSKMFVEKAENYS